MESDKAAGPATRRRYAPWSLVAIVTALLSLLLQGSLVPVNLAAAIFALMGLRQVQRYPERYIGRAFCWLAIGLVLLLALLNLLVEPTPPAMLDGIMVPE